MYACLCVFKNISLSKYLKPDVLRKETLVYNKNKPQSLFNKNYSAIFPSLYFKFSNKNGQEHTSIDFVYNSVVEHGIIDYKHLIIEALNGKTGI
jgi:hypothetical protein